MATITAGNFYWTGYKPAGLDPDFVYERGTTAFGTALSFVGGAGGCTGYSWNEPGNWVVQKSGFTNDPESPGGFIDGFYYEDAPRAPRAGDNVFYTELTPDAPGIYGFFPASECLFGGITGATDAGGGTWEAASGSGFTGNLNKVFVENNYSSSRGATFHLGNVIGSTFGQTFLGNSADIVLRGLTGLFGRGVTTNLIFTNTDGTTVEFLGNTFLNFIHGGTGSAAISAGISLQVELNENQFFIGTENKSGYGSTQATQALYNSLVTGVSSGYLKMDINTYAVGATYFGVTQSIPGVGGNTSLTGGYNPPGANSNGAFFLREVQGISAGNSPTGAGGAFSGGTDNPIEQPKLVIKTDTLTVRGDSNINFNNTTVDKQAFILSKCQFNYNAGLINQFILNREGIDYLGTPKTSASLLDTNVVNSVVISGGGFQREVFDTVEYITIPDGAIDPENYHTPETHPEVGPLEEVTVYFETNNAGATYRSYDNPHNEVNSIAYTGGLASCSSYQGCTMTQGGIGEAVGQLFLGRERQVRNMMPSGRMQSGGIDRALSFTQVAYAAPGSTLETRAHSDLIKSIQWPGYGFSTYESHRLYVKLVGQQSSRTAEYMIYKRMPTPAENPPFPGCSWYCAQNASDDGGFFETMMFADTGRLYLSFDDGGAPLTHLGYPVGEQVSGGNSTDTSYRDDSFGQFTEDVFWQEGYESAQLLDGYSGETNAEPPEPDGAVIPEGYFLDGEAITATFIRVPALRLGVNDDSDARKPITYVRPTNTIPNVVIDAMRHGNVVLEGAATTLDMKPEHEHQDANKQGGVFINRPLNFNDRLNYTTINLKSYNDAQNITGTKDNNLLTLNSGLTIGNLDIGAGTVSVGNNIGDRKITVVKGEMSERAVLKARSETNPSYQGFRIGDDFTAITSNAEGILISHPAADIEFSVGHYVLASFADGNTGADSGFQSPGGGGTPLPPSFGGG